MKHKRGKYYNKFSSGSEGSIQCSETKYIPLIIKSKLFVFPLVILVHALSAIPCFGFCPFVQLAQFWKAAAGLKHFALAAGTQNSLVILGLYQLHLWVRRVFHFPVRNKLMSCTLVHLWHAAWWEPNTFVAHAALTRHCRWTRSDHHQLMLPVTTSTSTRWTTCRRCATRSRCLPSCSACPVSTRTTSSVSRWPCAKTTAACPITIGRTASRLPTPCTPSSSTTRKFLMQTRSVFKKNYIIVAKCV